MWAPLSERQPKDGQHVLCVARSTTTGGVEGEVLGHWPKIRVLLRKRAEQYHWRPFPKEDLPPILVCPEHDKYYKSRLQHEHYIEQVCAACQEE